MRFFLNINFIHTGKRNEAVWLSSGTLIFFYLFCRSFWLGDIFRSYFFKSPTQFLLMKMKMLIQKKRKKITNQFQSLFILILFLKLKRFFAIEILKLKKIIKYWQTRQEKLLFVQKNIHFCVTEYLAKFY